MCCPPLRAGGRTKMTQPRKVTVVTCRQRIRNDQSMRQLVPFFGKIIGLFRRPMNRYFDGCDGVDISHGKRRHFGFFIVDIPAGVRVADLWKTWAGWRAIRLLSLADEEPSEWLPRCRSFRTMSTIRRTICGFDASSRVQRPAERLPTETRLLRFRPCG